MNHESPVPVHSPLYMIEIKSKTQQTINIGDQLYGESGIYILEGGIYEENKKENFFGPKQLLIAKDSSLCSFTIKENSTIYIFGGEAFPEKRYIDWNFVASDKETLEKAKSKWMSEDWEKIPTDTAGFVPYPSKISKKK